MIQSILISATKSLLSYKGWRLRLNWRFRLLHLVFTLTLILFNILNRNHLMLLFLLLLLLFISFNHFLLAAANDDNGGDITWILILFIFHQCIVDNCRCLLVMNIHSGWSFTDTLLPIGNKGLKLSHLDIVLVMILGWRIQLLCEIALTKCVCWPLSIIRVVMLMICAVNGRILHLWRHIQRVHWRLWQVLNWPLFVFADVLRKLFINIIWLL